MTIKAQQPSPAAMDAARELEGPCPHHGASCQWVADTAAIIDRHLSAERQEVREVLRELLVGLFGNQRLRERAEALLSKMGGE